MTKSKRVKVWYIPCIEDHVDVPKGEKNTCHGVAVNVISQLFVFANKEDVADYKKQYKAINGKIPPMREGTLIIQ